MSQDANYNWLPEAILQLRKEHNEEKLWTKKFLETGHFTNIQSASLASLVQLLSGRDDDAEIAHEFLEGITKTELSAAARNTTLNSSILETLRRAADRYRQWLDYDG